MKSPEWGRWLKNKKECKKWLDYYIKKKILRESKDNSLLYLKKAMHNLNFGNWILEKHKGKSEEFFKKDSYYDWIVSIYYYAIYHAGLALTSKKNYESKNHSATLCFLIYYYYHQEKMINEKDIEIVANSLDEEDIKTIGASKELRERASYNVEETFEREIAEGAKDDCVKFINKIRQLLG